MSLLVGMEEAAATWLLVEKERARSWRLMPALRSAVTAFFFFFKKKEIPLGIDRKKTSEFK